MRPAGEIQSFPEWHVPLHDAAHGTVWTDLAHGDIAWKKRPDGEEAKRDDGADAVLQIGHGTAGRKKGFRAASKSISRFNLSQRGACSALVRAELRNERIWRLEPHSITQSIDKFDTHVAAIPIPGRLE